MYKRQVSATRGSVDDPALRELIGESYHDRLMEEIELLDMAGDALDMEQVAQGQLTPMFFGSAMNNFGVQSFLEKFLAFTAPPTPRVSQGETVDPANPNFSGFIFKIQANMNPAHRDRLALSLIHI